MNQREIYAYHIMMKVKVTIIRKDEYIFFHFEAFVNNIFGKLIFIVIFVKIKYVISCIYIKPYMHDYF